MLIVGLGNPGGKYAKTRHNAGFRVVNEFSKKFDFPDFVLKKKLNAEILEGVIGEKKVILVKPQTYMNKSGEALAKIMSNVKAQIPNLVVVHDDIDLPIGKIRISQNSRSAGHKGVGSIINSLGSGNFVRLRIGILPEKGKPEKVEAFVLKNFTKDEEEILKEVFEKSILALETIISKGTKDTMNEFN